MSYSGMREGVAVRPASMADASDRLGFIRKVYALMFTGLLVFFGTVFGLIGGAVMGVPGITQFTNLLMSLPWWAHFVLLLGGSLLAHAVSMVRVVNIVAFYGFSFLFGCLSVGLVAYAAAIGGPMILLQALGMTVIVFGGLTAYVFISKKDFSFMGGFLTVGLFMLIGAALVAGIASSVFNADISAVSIGLSIVGCLLFSGYILYDTSNLMHRYATDMVVPAALALLIDFIIMFRNILYLLAASRD